MTRRLVVPLLVAGLMALGACSSSGDEETPTTIDVGATTTTVAPDETTSSTALPPRLPAAPTSGEVKALVTSTGVVVPVLARLDTAWRVGTPCGGEATVAGGRPLYGATVVLDPGHGGVETGAAGANDLVEKDLNLTVARLAATALEREGATVVLTRTGDYRVTLEARAAIAQRLQPPVFVSVHHNGGHDGPADRPGTETYYQHGSTASKRLAGLLYEEVYGVFDDYADVTWHANVDAGAKYRLNGAGEDYYGILRRTAGVTATLSEALFLSASDSEAALLARPEVQQAEAEAIASAIRRFMLGNDPGSGFVEPMPRTTPAGPGGGAAGCIDPPLD